MPDTPTFSGLRALLEADRSIRRFRQDIKVSEDTLKSLVELTRLCASGRNLQPLRYRIVTDAEECRRIFPALAWAGYYKDWDGPEEGERPAAYLVQCLDTELTTNPLCDEGLQLQAVTLGATALGLGGCIIKSFNRQMIVEELGLPENMDPRYVLALGAPAEKARILPLGEDGSIFYFRDSDGVQCVPKRSLEELIIS